MPERRKGPILAFAAVLRDLRAEKGLTQEALALEAGTERSHISALERAEKGPTLETILRLAKALDMPSGDLLTRVEERLSRKR